MTHVSNSYEDEMKRNKKIRLYKNPCNDFVYSLIEKDIQCT